MPWSTIAQLQHRIVEGQYAALDRLEAKDFGGTLLRRSWTRCSQRRDDRTREVAFDFWDQVKRRKSSMS